VAGTLTAGRQRAVLDTSVLLSDDVAPLPGELAISAASLAELHFGVLVTRDEGVRADRLRRLGLIESQFEALPVDASVARAYGHLAAAIVAAGRQPRARVMDLLIAATAAAHLATLYTRNPDDLRGLEDLLPVVAV
jgi:toxin FitB